MSIDFCPYCDEDIEDLYNEFVDHDYSTNFEMDCPRCGKTFEVEVHPVPDFTLTKKEK